ncbi:conserved hypothetical protein [Methanocaldococcus vulcanius M7]|uniref:Uncharacterized protein n=1 Tax=Methanocaldococcus vulcanius (strain ATCC 700851 / DSM 12094 / M7) TaxID=579137 RepID=C9RH47_METVM|nr:hypothetical protein [Methanocaldococcus vulcanius]ACX72899.1 conserved hypothetical protein [Methanocaldococcus vulcanius M7]
MTGFRGIIRDISNVDFYCDVISNEGKKEFTINKPFRIIQVSFSGFQENSPVIASVYGDERSHGNYYVYKGTTGEQFKKSPILINKIEVEVIGQVENPIFVNIVYEILEDNYGV